MPQQSESTPASVVLPEFWPVEDPTPVVRPVWIPWPIAILLAPLFWLMPKRLGPHFAAASWWAAIAGHLVWTVYGIACFVMLARDEQAYSVVAWIVGRTPEQLGQSPLPVPSFWETLRAPLSSLANEAFTASQVSELLVPLLCWLLCEVGLVVLAAMLMSYMTVGERTRCLFVRAVRLVLWASTSLAGLGMVILAIGLWIALPEPNSTFNPWPARQTLGLWDLLSRPAIALAGACYSAWLVWLIVRGGARYAGPARGPAWEPRAPHCESCGYSLTGLSIEGTCPECGSAVADSLPGKRHPSAFAAASGLLGRCRTFLPTAVAACRDRGFFKSLKTSDQNAGRRFVVWVCAVTAAMVVVPWMIGIRLTHDSSVPAMAWTDWTAALLAFWAYASTVLMLLAGMTVLVLSGFGRHRLEHYAVGIFYWSAWMLPIAVALPVTIAVAFWLNKPDRPLGTIAGLGLAALLVSIWMLVKALFALKHVICGVRFVNR